jgi:hypothetical protein
MRGLARSERSGRRAAAAAATGLVGIASFQVALAAGADWGHAAWGGAHAELTTGQRFGSAVAAVVWIAAALLVLARAGLGSGGGSKLVRRGTWVVVALLVVGAIPNLASQSRWESLLLGPLSLLLAMLCVVVARSGTVVAGVDAEAAAR